MSATAVRFGALITPGSRIPPARIVNLAGRRTPVSAVAVLVVELLVLLVEVGEPDALPAPLAPAAPVIVAPLVSAPSVVLPEPELLTEPELPPEPEPELE